MCASCWRTWRATSNACPICRQGLRTGAWQPFNNKTKQGKPAPPPKPAPTRKEAAAAVAAAGIDGEVGDEVMDLEEAEVEPDAPLNVLGADEMREIAGVASLTPLSSKTDFISKRRSRSTADEGVVDM